METHYAPRDRGREVFRLQCETAVDGIGQVLGAGASDDGVTRAERDAAGDCAVGGGERQRLGSACARRAWRRRGRGDAGVGRILDSRGPGARSESDGFVVSCWTRHGESCSVCRGGEPVALESGVVVQLIGDVGVCASVEGGSAGEGEGLRRAIAYLIVRLPEIESPATTPVPENAREDVLPEGGAPATPLVTVKEAPTRS